MPLRSVGWPNGCLSSVGYLCFRRDLRNKRVPCRSVTFPRIDRARQSLLRRQPVGVKVHADEQKRKSYFRVPSMFPAHNLIGAKSSGLIPCLRFNCGPESGVSSGNVNERVNAIEGNTVVFPTGDDLLTMADYRHNHSGRQRR